MKTLNVIYCLRVGFGILAAIVAALVVNLKVGDPLINGITIALAVYIVSYYVVKWQFANKVEKPTKILTMGIGAYFLVFIMVWVLVITPSLAPPTAVITRDIDEPLVGEAVTFDASNSFDPDGEIVRYAWNFGDESTSDQMNPTHYYSTAGEYVVILSVVDEHGISNTNTTTITVNVSG